ncbi:MAG: hypothetical protein JSS56_09025 [Proteobacteria bacterium]|nr:hypothetical protein [Pseudomonadota bacterium]
MAFEHRVQASRLLAMCLGMPSLGIPDGHTIVKLSFQGRVLGHNTDDLVIDFASAHGELGTLRMQLKRSLTPTASNSVFNEAVGLAWLDFKGSAFRRGRDVLLIVYQPASAKPMEPAVEVTRLAVASSVASDWKEKVHTTGFSNRKNQDAFSAMAAAAREYNSGVEVDLSELHQFAVHLRFAHHDLDSDVSAEALSQKQLLAVVTHQDTAGLHWSKLVEICAELNGVGGDVTLDTAERFLGQPLSDAFRAWRAVRQSGAGLFGLVQGQLAAQSAGGFNAPIGASAFSKEKSQVVSDSAPPSRSTSLNKLVSRQLDSINVLLKEMRYREASEQLLVLGQDQSDFDSYQRALWHLLRGMCRWHWNDDLKGAAEDFLRSAELDEDEAKFAAARIRGHLLNENTAQAMDAGLAATKRFPSAYEVWLAYANARVVSGEILTEADIPAEHRSLAVAWQLVASAQERAGDFAAAFEMAKRAVEQPDSSFFCREALLRYALQDASQNPIGASYRALPTEQFERLQTAIGAFSDRSKSLWVATQSPRALCAAVTHLGYAFILVGRPDAALDLLSEAKSREVHLDGAEVRIEIDANRDLNQGSDALSKFDERLGEVPADALIAYAQAALEGNDEKRIRLAASEAERRDSASASKDLVRTLRNLRWEFLLRSSRSTDVANEVAADNIDAASDSILDLMFAIRSNQGDGGDRKLVLDCLDKVAELVKGESDSEALHVGAQVLLRSQRYQEAAEAYLRILIPQTFTQLHIDLLHCYLRLGQFAKGRDLLASLPSSWIESDDARHLALDLAQMVRDWKEVARLATVELERSPTLCRSWILRITAAAHVDGTDIVNLAEAVPLDLEGTAQELARLAAIELRHGQVEKAVLRLYQMRRGRLHETEAAALHLTSVLLTGTKLKELEHDPEFVSSGTSVLIEGADGASRYLTIDPSVPLNLPPTEEFVGASSAEAAPLLGRRVGEEVVIKGPFGDVKTLRVLRIVSAHRRLIDLSHTSLQTTLTPNRFMTSMQMPTAPDGEPELDSIRQQVEQRVLYATETLDLYRQHPAPLGIIGGRLGVDVVDLVRGWPSAGPKLEMSNDWSQSHEAALNLLKTEERWVLDLSMLTELAALGQLEVLTRLPGVFVATATRDAVLRKLEETAVFRTSGTMFTQGGQLGFRENTKEDWERERAFLNSMAQAVDKYCTVEPAYGPPEVERSLHRMRRVLSAEEYATLLLSLQLNASVLTLDGRFRRICMLFGRQGAWPQPLLILMQATGHLDVVAYSSAVLKLMLSRRTFVSLRSTDLVCLMAKDDEFVRFGLTALSDYLADGVLNFASGERVLFLFLTLMHRSGATPLPLTLQLLEHLAEGLFRHPSVPPAWSGSCAYQAWIALELHGAERQEAVESVIRAAQRASRPVQPVAINLGTLDRTPLAPFAEHGTARQAEPVGQEGLGRSAPAVGENELSPDSTEETLSELGTPEI